MQDPEEHLPLPRDQASSVKKAIHKIRNATVEHLYFFKNGKQIRRFKGEYNNVRISDKYLYEINNSSIVHNHPQGSSFSIEDVVGLIKYNAAECLLVTETYIYQLTRPKLGWDIDVESAEFMEKYNACKAIADAELNKLVSSNNLTQAEKEIEIIHYIWLLFFTQLNNISYVRKKIEEF